MLALNCCFIAFSKFHWPFWSQRHQTLQVLASVSREHGGVWTSSHSLAGLSRIALEQGSDYPSSDCRGRVPRRAPLYLLTLYDALSTLGLCPEAMKHFPGEMASPVKEVKKKKREKEKELFSPAGRGCDMIVGFFLLLLLFINLNG